MSNDNRDDDGWLTMRTKHSRLPGVLSPMFGYIIIIITTITVLIAMMMRDFMTAKKEKQITVSSVQHTAFNIQQSPYVLLVVLQYYRVVFYLMIKMLRHSGAA
jgi:hypothetical protein